MCKYSNAHTSFDHANTKTWSIGVVLGAKLVLALNIKAAPVFTWALSNLLILLLTDQPPLPCLKLCYKQSGAPDNTPITQRRASAAATAFYFTKSR